MKLKAAPRTFSTAHMMATQMTMADLDELSAMFADPQFVAVFGVTRTRDQVKEAIEKNVVHWQQHGFGYYVFRDKKSHALIGRGGLRCIDTDGLKGVEIAYALMPNFWGKGLATEMARACIDIAFNILGLHEIIGFTTTTNKGSQRIMEKLGFKFERNFTYADLPHVLYTLKHKD